MGDFFLGLVLPWYCTAILRSGRGLFYLIVPHCTSFAIYFLAVRTIAWNTALDARLAMRLECFSGHDIQLLLHLPILCGYCGFGAGMVLAGAPKL